MESINVDTKRLATIRNIHNFQLKNLLLKSTDMSLTPMFIGRNKNVFVLPIEQ